MNKFLISLKAYFFLGLLLILCAAFFYFHLNTYLTLDALQKYHLVAQAWANTHYKSAVSLYILLFTGLIACTIPCATLFTLIGGFLFGYIALLYAVLSTTAGGLILFFAARTALGARIAAKSTGWIKKMEAGFQRNAFNYLLTLRLIPIFPCWISNIGAGALNVPVITFISATVLGIFPATLIYVLAGRSLDKLLSDSQAPLLNIIFTPSILFPLLGLAILSIFPVIYKFIKNRFC